MRELSRLLIQLKKPMTIRTPNFSTLSNPCKFDVVIEAVKKLCNFETKDDQQDVRTPSLALKIGHLLKKCVNVVRGQALREKDKDSQEDTDSFEKLID